ncbi:MAG: methyl-accepting chemotaxis protein [Planctomycetota bacterium]
MPVWLKLAVLIGALAATTFGSIIATRMITNSMAADGLTINLAGRQRMLTQKMTKEFAIWRGAATEEDRADAAATLSKTAGLFDRTLTALLQGGTTTGGNGTDVTLEPVKGEAPIAALYEGAELWAQLKPGINAVTSGELAPTDPIAEEAFATLAASNIRLLKIMNKATVAMQHGSSDKLAMLTIAQIGSAIVTVLVAVLGWLGGQRYVVRPLNAVASTMRELTEGDGDLSRRVVVYGADELAETATAVNEFIGKLEALVASVSGVTSEISGATGEINASMWGLSETLNAQQSQVEQVSAAAEECAASVAQVSGRSTQGQEHASDARAIVAETQEAFGATINDLETISGSVRDASEGIDALAEQGEAIGRVITVIDEIADQTNLLALNAAIEAARAGEQGRGFAVVADQVRKLAERTTQATSEIADSIRAVQEQTEVTKAAMDRSAESIAGGVQRATSAANQAQRAAQASDELASVVSEISSAAEQQRIAVEEVSRAMAEIAQAVSSASETGQTTAESVSAIESKSQELPALMERYGLRANELQAGSSTPA